MKLNEASWDRIARVVLGVALIISGLAAVGGSKPSRVAQVSEYLAHDGYPNAPS